MKTFYTTKQTLTWMVGVAVATALVFLFVLVPTAAAQEGMTPTFMVVPSLDVVASVEPVGQTDDGAMDVPTDWRDIAWYEPGYAPGENGHAALAAHRDWEGNAGPFWGLTTMQTGDLIAVADDAGRVMVYTTVSNTRYGRNADVTQQVFGASEASRLSLITCEGTFVDSEDTYDKRQVVEAELLYDSATGELE